MLRSAGTAQMHLDVIDLRAFYCSPLGQIGRRMIRRRIRLIWPDLRGLSLLGLGYATPYLRAFQDEAERVLAFMPAAQGVSHWPSEAASLTALVEDTELPLPDASIDRILLAHALENSEQARAMLREVWRVLAPSGRLLILVPNRRGIWARIETTPFGHGRPFSRPQLTRLLREAMFSPIQWDMALYMPPIERRFLLRSAPAWERLGARYWPRFAGVLLVEASKQIYAVTPNRMLLRRWPAAAPAPALIGLGPRPAGVGRHSIAEPASLKAGESDRRRPDPPPAP